nr:anthranilate phosphoribosyltransferase [Candidatus Sigynarchaeota archaeon]
MSEKNKTGIKEAIQKKIVEHKPLESSEAYAAMHDIMDGTATPAQIGAFLVALKVQEPGIPEVSAMVRCMKDFANKVHPAGKGPIVDTCGTGGDTLKTINISTLSALVAAGAGVTIAKHGNRSVTSPCGSADVLEHFGVNIMAQPGIVEQCINKTGIGFMFAPVFHPAMKYASGPRKEIGLKTIFNVLGPLTNPASANGQVLGVYDKALMDVMASVLLDFNVNHFFIVYNEHGADELLPVGKNIVKERSQGKVLSRVFEAKDFGLPEAALKDLMINASKEENIKRFTEILKGRGPEALFNAVLMNSAMAIIAGERAKDILEAVALARKSLESGAALAKLKQLVVESGGNLQQFEKAMGAI